MIRLAKVKILTAGPGQARRKFSPDESAEQREYAAENPNTENQKRRVHVERDDVRIDEDAGADDDAHDDHGGVERVEPARWGDRCQERENISEVAGSQAKVGSGYESKKSAPAL